MKIDECLWNESIPFMDTFTLLELVIDDKLTSNNHITTLCVKATLKLNQKIVLYISVQIQSKFVYKVYFRDLNFLYKFVFKVFFRIQVRGHLKKIFFDITSKVQNIQNYAIIFFLLKMFRLRKAIKIFSNFLVWLGL